MILNSPGLRKLKKYKALSYLLVKRKLEEENMDIVWLDERTATIPEYPDVTITFSETEDGELIDTVLGMLLQTFSK